jgi:hypothetical protein
MASTAAIYNSPAIMRGSRRHPVAAAQILHAGNLLVIDTATGLATGGASGAGLRCIGRAGNTVDNLTGAAGAQWVIALQQPAVFDNSVASPLGIQDIGLPVFIETSRIVAKVIGVNPVTAGVLIGFEGTKPIVDQSNL